VTNFEELYPRLSDSVTRFIAKRSGATPEIVEEIASQTMVSAWKGWHTFKHKSSYLTWVCRIALNKLADYYRSQFNRQSTFIAPFIESLIEPELPNFEEKIALDELKVSVSRWLTLLSPENRRLLQLKYWEEATNAQIAQVLGVSTKAVENKLYRARKSLASVVAKDGGSKV
jgi:RNA polymerase sigma factor (sigma-70 family)